tara:strand:- start:2042 stop:2497 length:456 start_codon:yes stop_codon:yes gene_type:complete
MVSTERGQFTIISSGVDFGLVLSVGDDTLLGFNFVDFFDSNWAIELLAATPFYHDIELHAAVAMTLLADTKQLLPTLSALYYFNTGSVFKPYVGVGINYTVFFDNSLTSNYSDAGFSDTELENSFAVVDNIGSASVDVNPMVYSVMLGYKF